MLPEIAFVVGTRQVVLSVHALAIVVGVAAGATLALRRARDPAPVLVALPVVAVAALVGAHVCFLALRSERGGVWTGGLASMGGVAAGLAAAAVVARAMRRRAAELLDAIAPAGLLALGIGRVGCFLAGCCYGRATSLPWGVVFPEVGPPARHPLQLYSSAVDLALVLLLPARAARAGLVACRACLGFAIARAALETLRDPATTDALAGAVTVPQAATLVLAIGALACARRLRHREGSIMPRARRGFVHGR